jgi:hypothetical protein
MDQFGQIQGEVQKVVADLMKIFPKMLSNRLARPTDWSYAKGGSRPSENFPRNAIFFLNGSPITSTTTLGWSWRF